MCTLTRRKTTRQILTPLALTCALAVLVLVVNRIKGEPYSEFWTDMAQVVWLPFAFAALRSEDAAGCCLLSRLFGRGRRVGRGRGEPIFPDQHA